MNRSGLIIALAIAALAGLVFGLFPQLDIALARPFYDFASRDFILRFDPLLAGLRTASTWIIAALIAPAVIALVVKLVRPQRRMLIPARAAVFLLATLILGPGLLVNVILKDNWPRSRPIDVPPFTGSERFVAWWDPRGDCPKNCSFVAGEASGAFWTLAPAALVPPPWRPLAYVAAVTFGLATGFLRLAFGGHFLSDVIFAGVFMFLLIWTAHGLIYRWRATRLSDEAVEKAIERLTLPFTSLAARFFPAARRPASDQRANKTK